MCVRAELVAVLIAAAILGIWHLGMGGRALFVFRNDEPLSSWVWVFSGFISTLPAAALAIFSRRWSAGWLIMGGLISLGALVARGGGKGDRGGEFWGFLLSHAITVTVPMIGLGLGLLWLQRHLEGANFRRTDSQERRHKRHRYRLLYLATLSGYILLSLGAIFGTNLPIASKALETTWGLWSLPPLLGPLAVLAMVGVLGVPLYLVATVIVFAFLWLAAAHERWRRTALLSALMVWLLSGLFLLAMVQWG